MSRRRCRYQLLELGIYRNMAITEDNNFKNLFVYFFPISMQILIYQQTAIDL